MTFRDPYGNPERGIWGPLQPDTTKSARLMMNSYGTGLDQKITLDVERRWIEGGQTDEVRIMTRVLMAPLDDTLTMTLTREAATGLRDLLNEVLKA